MKKNSLVDADQLNLKNQNGVITRFEGTTFETTLLFLFSEIGWTYYHWRQQPSYPLAVKETLLRSVGYHASDIVSKP